jgi:hypothetical protein
MILGPAIVVQQSVLAALHSRTGRWLNRYQVAVAVHQPACTLVVMLEALVDVGIIEARGAASESNNRVYRFGGKGYGTRGPAPARFPQ